MLIIYNAVSNIKKKKTKYKNISLVNPEYCITKYNTKLNQQYNSIDNRGRTFIHHDNDKRKLSYYCFSTRNQEKNQFTVVIYNIT